MSEFIYILDNRSIQLATRIIKTDKDTPDIPKYLLYLPGVRAAFTVFMKYAVSDADEAERRIQQNLSQYQDTNDPTLFGLDAWQAAPLLDRILADLMQQPTPAAQDTQRQDDLLAAATKIVISLGKVWPSALAGPLSISFEEAQQLIRNLEARGVINADLDLSPDYLAMHLRQEAEKRAEIAAAQARQQTIEQERRRREAEQRPPPPPPSPEPQTAEQERRAKGAAEDAALAKLNPELVQAVTKLLDGLVDPQTGEPVEVRFVDDNGRLAVDIRGTEWVRLEAEKRLSSLYDDPHPS